jgi:hypothetical protein
MTLKEARDYSKRISDLEKLAKREPTGEKIKERFETESAKGNVIREIWVHYNSIGEISYEIQWLTEEGRRTIGTEYPTPKELYKNRFIQFLSQIQSLFQGKLI